MVDYIHAGERAATGIRNQVPQASSGLVLSASSAILSLRALRKRLFLPRSSQRTDAENVENKQADKMRLSR